MKLLILITGFFLMQNYAETDLSLWLNLETDVVLSYLLAVFISPWVVDQLEA